MIEFWIASTAMMAAVVTFLVQPLRRSRTVTEALSSTAANVAVYRRQIAELESDRRSGLLSGYLVAGEREEIEQRLLADLSVDTGAGTTRSSSTPPGPLMLWLIVGVPAAAILFYAATGTR